jgi:Cu/Ag efflux protein CusF
MKKRSIAIAGLMCAPLLASCSHRRAEPPPPPPPAATTTTAVVDTPSGGAVAESTTTVTATVKAVDVKKRLVTLQGPQGNTMTVHVGDEVKNLPQVRKGDQVTATYYESLAIDIAPPGQAKPGVASASDLMTAPPGQKPSAAGAQSVTVTSKVTNIDKKTQHVTLRGPKGKSVTLKVKDPTRLEQLKVGDLVQVTYTEAVAIAVQPAPKH